MLIYMPAVYHEGITCSSDTLSVWSFVFVLARLDWGIFVCFCFFVYLLWFYKSMLVQVPKKSPL